MEIKDSKKSRSDLKSYFVKNAIPTESNFAELIGSMLNQRDDGLVKPADGPLSIEASGDGASQKKAVNFYYDFTQDNPDWVLSLNPSSKPADPKTAHPGFSISDGDGNSRLFIDRQSGNVGIGTTAPGAKLEVNGDIKATKLEVVGSFKATSNISGERELSLEAPSSGNHRKDGGTQAATGLVYRVTETPAGGDPIFQVRSTAETVRFFVEHDGWTGSAENSAWFGGGKANYFAGNVSIGKNDPQKAKWRFFPRGTRCHPP